MFDNFILKETPKGKIAGYTWPLKDPEKVVLIIHGIGEYAGRFDRVAEKFRQAGMAVLSMDLRGHGMSMNSYGHCAPRIEVLNDISDLIRHAFRAYPGKPIILYGHSMGGNITLDYRARGQLNDAITGYIISAPWIRLKKAVGQPAVKLAGALKHIMPAFTIGSDVDEKVLGHPESVGWYHGNPLVHNRISLETAYDGFVTGMRLFDGTNESNDKASHIPMLIMHGSSDAICDVEGSRQIAGRLSREGQPVEYVEWEGFFHEIHNGNREDRGDVVIDKAVSWAKEVGSR